MKITAVRADPLKLATILVRVYTDDGTVGLGQLIGRKPAAAVAYINDVLTPLVIAEDPTRTDRLWERMYWMGNGRFGWIQAIAALDMACLDIRGKAAGKPIYDLLGGAARTTIPLYWSMGRGLMKSPEQMLADVEKGWKLGFRAFKIRMDWHELRLDEDPAKDIRMARLCREFLPEGVPLGFDANGGYTVSTAIRQGLILQELGIGHFEEPIRTNDVAGLRAVADALALPVAFGEFEKTRWRFRELIELGNPDILQPDILNAGGPSEVKRIYELAETFGKPVMPHSPDVGITSFASLHVYSTVTNATHAHEYSPELYDFDADRVQEMFEEPVLPTDGTIRLSDKPGLGLTLREKALDQLIVS